MKYLKIIILAALVLVPLAVIFIFFLPQTDNTKQIQEDVNKLLDAKTVQDCDVLSEKVDRIPNCDGNVCLDNGSHYGTLMASCMAAIGVKNNDASICTDSERNKNICKKTNEIFPQVSKMPAPYLNINDCAKSIEKSCVLEYLKKAAPETQVVIKCESYNNPDDRDSCFLELAIRNNDSNLCANIETDTTTMQMDQEACYDYLAIRNNDEKICNIFKLDTKVWPERNSVYAGNCNKLLTTFRNNNSIAACDNMSLNYYGSSTKEACLMFYAIFNHDVALCNGKDVYNQVLCKKLANLPIK